MFNSERVTRWVGVFALVAVLAFGVLVEVRSAFLKRHMTDLGVYLRTAWALRAGEDIYDIADDNGWHYQYPPLFAILMMPLADPLPGYDRAGMLPFGLSVALWYVFSLGCLVFAVHRLATALEEQSGGERRWWTLRVSPDPCALLFQPVR